MAGQYNEFVNTLPDDFDGDFYFTNPDDEEFIGKWGGKGYVFAPGARSKMVIRGAAPEEVQQIRKKFARELAEKMFFKSEKAKQMVAIERQHNGEPVLRSIHQANVYTDLDLKDYIQACLSPLPVGKLQVTELAKESVEEKLHRDEDGEIVSRAVRQREALKEKVFRDSPMDI